MEQTKPITLRTDGQRRVQEQAQGFTRLGADLAQSLGSRVSDVIASRGVLRAKDNGARFQAQALESAAGVGSQDAFKGDFVIGV